ncbi:Hypothetical protein NTJ_14904 [Nesidiocoris tenuis]|uniref:FZ domain-containing protein n=1 Tax=Nesidiocoris tenuis TaxID=355587 RepID=A0ABN7BCH7_9HEMI|nr:Hypothetical protein NTJ_14904 [Nesidiocoris tenuis]
MISGRRDFSAFLCCAILVALLLMLNMSQGQGAIHELNCRKYVFAPACRGVAAKRSLHHSPPASYLSASPNLLRIPGFQEYLLSRKKLAF